MKLDYKSKKWDKEFAKLSKVLKSMNGEPSGICNLKYMTSKIIENVPHGKRNYEVYLECCYDNYELAAGTYYILNTEDYRAVDYTYLSGLAGVLLNSMNDEKTENGNLDLQMALYQLIATEQTETTYLASDDGIISCMFTGNYEKAKVLLADVQEDTETVYGSYYRNFSCLKRIYMAILEKNEKAFNEELMNRIKRYRKNMVGYTTKVDYISVALIKMARKAGINYTFDVIEIPQLFFDESYRIDQEKVKIPYIDEILRELQNISDDKEM